MYLLQDTFRLWWQKPRSIADIPEERSISFLELFYDLAYVVIVIQLTHTLAGHLEWSIFLQYIGLYAMVWFAWVNGSLYHELHGNNDIRSRTLTFLQMFALVWIGIFIPTAFSPEGYQGFAVAYGGFLAVIGFLWWRTGVHDPEHRPLSYPYALSFLGATLAFLISTQLPMLLAQQVWLGAITYMLVVPFIFSRIQRTASPEHVEQAQRIRPSLVERFGLLTIILLGENLISIVGAASDLQDTTVPNVAMVSASVLIVFSLWWVYFDFISSRLPRQTVLSRLAWVYLHLPLTMSIGLVAVGLLNMIEYVTIPTAFDRWFIVAPAALFLVVIVALLLTLPVRYVENKPIYKKAALAALLAALGLIVIGWLQLPVLSTVVATWLLLTVPAVAGFLMWIRRRHQAMVHDA